jgi:hypothetical protein
MRERKETGKLENYCKERILNIHVQRRRNAFTERRKKESDHYVLEFINVMVPPEYKDLKNLLWDYYIERSK